MRTRRVPAWLRYIAAVLIVAIGLHSMSPLSYGNIVSSAPVATEDARASDLATIQQFLEQKVVQHRLEELGFTQKEIEQRLALANDEELHHMVVQSEKLMAGGGASVVTILLIVLLVLLILRIADAGTDIEPEVLTA